MRSAITFLATSALLFATLGVPAVSADPERGDEHDQRSGVYHLVVPRRAVGAGEQVELRLEPPAPAGLRVNWTVVGLGNHMAGLSLPLYRAPYVIPAGTPPAKVTVGLSGPGVRIGVSAEIELQPGRLPGAEECLGPGETFSTVWGDIELTGNFYVDTLPELIHRVDPVYPRNEFERGRGDTLTVNALVCRSGHVLDAYAIPRYRDRNDREPIEADRRLADAAIAAVRQYLFHPAMSYGQPVAVWVATRVIFRR